MSCNELKRLLRWKGCTFVEGTRHTHVTWQGRSTVIPRHGKAAVKAGTLKAILAALGLTIEDLR